MPMTSPKVSIITPVFNAEETIEETIMSVKAQTYDNIEHIIIDGRSTDRSLDVIRAHASSGLKIVSDPDHGIYDALNKGIALSTGNIIGIVHSDDFLADADAIRKIVHTFTDRRVIGVYSDLDYVSRRNPQRIIRHWTSGHFAPGNLRRGWMPPHPTLYIRKSVYQEFGGFDTRFQVSADYDFILRFLSRTHGRVIYLPQSFYKMRSGGTSSRKLITKMKEDYFAIRRNNVGGIFTLLGKNFSKIPQFFRSRELNIEQIPQKDKI
ncbi:glycosyltransferase family 2 protein [Alphaproteobacteria bacterium LSUCC0684]